MTAACGHADCAEHEDKGLAMACLRDRTAGRRFSTCPGCGDCSELTHYETVHNGVGLEEFDHLWECWRCGEYRYDYESGAFVFRDREEVVTHKQAWRADYPFKGATPTGPVAPEE